MSLSPQEFGGLMLYIDARAMLAAEEAKAEMWRTSDRMTPGQIGRQEDLIKEMKEEVRVMRNTLENMLVGD